MPIMRILSAPALLAVWEQGLVQRPAQRALTLLHAAVPEASVQTLAQLSIGQRNALLLTLRKQTFGSQLASVATCPACSQRLELNFAVSDIRVTPSLPSPSEGEDGGKVEVLLLHADGYTVRFRLPNSLDLLAIADQEDVASARQQLLARCLLSVHQNSEAVAADQLPADLADKINAQMDQADPQADIQFALACPACGHRWQAAFDIVYYLWREVDDWAVRILRDVHVLASAYGWSETDILTMHPWRRQIYLEMLSG